MTTMPAVKLLLFAFFALILAATSVRAMGICFGGYPACCENGTNTCGPFCASCHRVSEFVKMMRMFRSMMGSPSVFRIINPHGHHGGVQTQAVPIGFSNVP